MHTRNPAYLMFLAMIGLSGFSPGQAFPESARDMDMTWIEKYVTYAQDHHGRLQATDYHFMAEVIYAKRSTIKNVVSFLFVEGSDTPLASYDENDPFAFTNGLFYTRKSKSYSDLASLEAAHPAIGHYVWEIHGPGGNMELAPIRIGGPELSTRIPDTSPIYLSQSGRPVTDFNNIEPDMSLGIGWDPFTIGAQLEGTNWDDLVFVLVSDCHGRVVYTSGAPEDEEGFADFSATSTEMPAELLEPGMDYVVFISQVNYVDANISHGVEQLAANSFAVELEVRTAGLISPGRSCPEPAQKAAYLWSGKTPAGSGMVPWPAFLDPSNTTPEE